jgi:hypothetical protein
MVQYSHTTNERRSHMSANLYTVPALLVGKTYRSETLEGEIISAEPHNTAWYDGAEAYRVEVRSYDLGVSKYSYRTVAVAV